VYGVSPILCTLERYMARSSSTVSEDAADGTVEFFSHVLDELLAAATLNASEGVGPIEPECVDGATAKVVGSER
jgi:hypothetical protein